MRYSEERQTRQAGSIVYSERTTFFSIKIVLYSVYVPSSAMTLFKNNVATRQVELCFVHASYTTSVGKQPLHAFKLAHGLPFHREMSSTVYPARVWLGTKREYVHGAPILFLYTYTTYAGLCERDTNVERYSVWVRESFLGWGQSKNVTYAMCVK